MTPNLRSRPPKDIFAAIPSFEEESPLAKLDQTSVSGLFLKPGLKELDR